MSFFRDGTYGEAERPIDDALAPIVGNEVQVVTVAPTARRGRPTVAARSNLAGAGTTTGSRKPQGTVPCTTFVSTIPCRCANRIGDIVNKTT